MILRLASSFDGFVKMIKKCHFTTRAFARIFFLLFWTNLTFWLLDSWLNSFAYPFINSSHDVASANFHKMKHRCNRSNITTNSKKARKRLIFHKFFFLFKNNLRKTKKTFHFHRSVLPKNFKYFLKNVLFLNPWSKDYKQNEA